MLKNDSLDNFLKQNSEIDLSVKTVTSDKVYSILSKAIFRGELKPGQRLVESKLAKLMKVSRTPIREAIIELEQKGLVVSSPPKGVRVAPLPTKEALNEFYDISSVLRGLAVRKAIDNNYITKMEIRQLEEIITESELFLKEGSLRNIANLNLKFHNIIEECSRSKELINIIDNLYKKSRERFSEIISKADRQKKSIEEHKKIVKAIIEKDAILAENLMREHIINGKESLIKEFELRESSS
ncbi:MAG: GntR family transcriptional regulator [Atribacterota bacterium]|nr:GntR family transcriptional regulator [Atribacterota bacterium]MDD5636521.1 GntR family transcriptional regulator [Atribacterota bacterium]